MRIRLLLVAALAVLSSLSAQIHPSAGIVLGDTLSTLTVTDLFVGQDGVTYFTGQHVNSRNSLYIAAVSPSGERIFELFRSKKFEEKGLLIRPYDQDHFIVCGHSEDSTGTFNVRLLKLTFSGTVVWETTFGDDGTGTMEMPEDIAIDSKGNILVGGISQSSEIKYLLLKFSSSGQLLWSRKSVPFATGLFTVHDIVLDAADNIYGVTNNTFVADSSNGTVFKWDSSGAVVWSRNFNLTCFEERGTNLALNGDTLTVAGTPWTNGENSVAVTVLRLRTNGDLLSYRKIPLSSIQQGIRDLRLLPDGSIVLLNETFTPPNHRLHLFLLSAALVTVYHDSLLTAAPPKGMVAAVTGGSFTVIRYGEQLSKVTYTVSGGGVLRSAPQVYDIGGRTIELAYDAPPFLAVTSRMQSMFHERIYAAFFPSLPLSAEHTRSVQPKDYRILSAYPNPFNPSTTVVVHLPVRSDVSLSVYDLLGRRISSLISEVLDAGTHTRTWNASGLSGGMYFVRLRTGGTLRTLPLLLLK